MYEHWLLTWDTPVALLPVVVFLAALIYFDSFKLVSVKLITGIIVVGAATAGASYFVNGAVYNQFDMEFVTYSRYVAPWVVEVLKGLLVVVFVHTRRVGLLVDALIVGFALGAGFALVENVFYLAERTNAVLLVQIIRGFGTAIMHGGATGIFAMISVALYDRHPDGGLQYFLPGFVCGVVLHSAFNHLLVQPFIATAVMAVVLPVAFYFVFKRSESGLRDWMESDLNAKLTLLNSIKSGQFLDTPSGRYLQSLRNRFDGETLADMLCYMRLQGELALRANGLILMREVGLGEEGPDPEIQSGLAELAHLERAVGKTALMTLRPILTVTGKDLWQLNLLGGTAKATS